MSHPQVSRPLIPGAPIPDGDDGLLNWAWALDRLASSQNYWLSTVWPDGRPHSMPVWGVWHDTAIWFFSSIHARKIQNLRGEPRCVLTTQDVGEPVVFEGVAETVTEPGRLQAFLRQLNQKYEVDLGADTIDPAQNATVRVAPQRVIALPAPGGDAFPTRWTFPEWVS